MPERIGPFSPKLLTSRRGFFEIWFGSIVHPQERRALWVRYTAFRPNRNVSSYQPMALLWGAYFDRERPSEFRRQIQSWPLEALRFDGDALTLPAGELRPDRLRGELPGLGWDLAIEHRFAPDGHAPGWLEALPMVKTRSAIVSPFGAVSGSVRIDGHERSLDGASCVLTHIWGTERVRKLFWCFVPSFDPPHEEWGLDFVSVKADRVAPWLTMAFLRQGDRLVSDHRLVTMLRGRCEPSYPSFSGSCGLGEQRLFVDARADPGQAASYLYPDPNGSPRYIVQSDVGSVRCRVQRRGEADLELISSTAAVEFHGVERWDQQEPLAPPPL